MKKPVKTSKKNKFPKGWNEQRVQRLIKRSEGQSDAGAAAADDALFDRSKHTVMQIPTKLVPAVRRLLKKKAS